MNDSYMIKKMFPSLNIIITKDKYPRTFSILYELKQFSGLYYNCNFEHDICVMNRLHGCCCTCMNNYGYFKYDSFILVEPEKIIDKFTSYRNPKFYGFLEIGKGCVLPRYIRSNPCNINSCLNLSDNDTKTILYHYDDLISNINKKLCEPNIKKFSDVTILYSILNIKYDIHRLRSLDKKFWFSCPNLNVEFQNFIINGDN